MITPGDNGGGGSTSNVCPISPFDTQTTINNLEARVTAIETILSQLLGVDITTIQLSDISQDAGALFSSMDGILGTSVGYQPYAEQPGADVVNWELSPAAPDIISLSVVGGMVAIPIMLSAKMRLGGVTMRVAGFTGAAFRMDLYKETFEGHLTRVAKFVEIPSFDSGGTFRSVARPPDPSVTLLNPGAYYLTVQSTGGGHFSIAAHDSTGDSLTPGAPAVFGNFIRIGDAAVDTDELDITGPSWVKHARTVWAILMGIIQNEPLPYGTNIDPSSPYYPWYPPL